MLKVRLKPNNSHQKKENLFYFVSIWDDEYFLVLLWLSAACVLYINKIGEKRYYVLLSSLRIDELCLYQE